MIIEFSIENFGPIRDRQTLSFRASRTPHLESQYISPESGDLRLLKLALIYGANGSGKTYVLKALDCLRRLVLEPVDHPEDLMEFQPFLLDETSAGKPTHFILQFLHEGLQYKYELSLLRTAILTESLRIVSPKKLTVFKRETDLDKRATKVLMGAGIPHATALENRFNKNILWNNTVLGGYQKISMEEPIITAALRWFRDALHRMVLPGPGLLELISDAIDAGVIHKEAVIDILRKGGFPAADLSAGAHMLSGLQLARDLKGRKYWLPVSSQSSGFKRYFILAGLINLLSRSGKVIPVDELEGSLHPELFKHFLLTYLSNSQHSQLIATTHHVDLFGDRDLFRCDAIWFTEQSKDAATQLYSLADFDGAVTRYSANILNIYKSGRLGGLPELEDHGKN